MPEPLDNFPDWLQCDKCQTIWKEEGYNPDIECPRCCSSYWNRFKGYIYENCEM